MPLTFWEAAKLQLGTLWRMPGVLSAGVIASPKAVVTRGLPAAAVAVGGLAAGVGIAGAVGGAAAARGAGAIGSTIGATGTNPTLREQFTRGLSSPVRSYGQKSVKQTISETVFKEVSKAGKAALKKRVSGRPKRRRRARTVEYEEEETGAVQASRKRRKRSKKGTVGTVARKRKGKRARKPPTAKQLAARKRFAERYGGKRRRGGVKT